jgi:hypothetical protein
LANVPNHFESFMVISKLIFLGEHTQQFNFRPIWVLSNGGYPQKKTVEKLFPTSKASMGSETTKKFRKSCGHNSRCKKPWGIQDLSGPKIPWDECLSHISKTCCEQQKVCHILSIFLGSSDSARRF